MYSMCTGLFLATKYSAITNGDNACQGYSNDGLNEIQISENDRY